MIKYRDSCRRGFLICLGILFVNNITRTRKEQYILVENIHGRVDDTKYELHLVCVSTCGEVAPAILTWIGMFSKGKAGTPLLVRKLLKSLFVCFNDVTFVPEQVLILNITCLLLSSKRENLSGFCVYRRAIV